VRLRGLGWPDAGADADASDSPPVRLRERDWLADETTCDDASGWLRVQARQLVRGSPDAACADASSWGCPLWWLQEFDLCRRTVRRSVSAPPVVPCSELSSKVVPFFLILLLRCERRLLDALHREADSLCTSRSVR
jgi:hypothetical protein